MFKGEGLGVTKVKMTASTVGRSFSSSFLFMRYIYRYLKVEANMDLTSICSSHCSLLLFLVYPPPLLSLSYLRFLLLPYLRHHHRHLRRRRICHHHLLLHPLLLLQLLLFLLPLLLLFLLFFFLFLFFCCPCVNLVLLSHTFLIEVLVEQQVAPTSPH